jgi:hypothetical protein
MNRSDGAKAAFEVGKGKQSVLVLSEAQVMKPGTHVSSVGYFPHAR